VEHAERHDDWTAEMADNLLREETTTKIDQLTIEIENTNDLGVLQEWMLKPKPNWALPERLVDFGMTNL
jgi:hypothetical protein